MMWAHDARAGSRVSMREAREGEPREPEARRSNHESPPARRHGLTPTQPRPKYHPSQNLFPHPRSSWNATINSPRPIFALLLATAATPVASPVRPGFEITGNSISPESLTSASNGDVFVGSARLDIYRLRRGADAPGNAVAAPWAQAPASGPPMIFGVFADEAAHTLWACAAEYPESKPPAPRSTLYGFDLETGRQTRAYPLPTPRALCNDISRDAAGNLYVTDSINNEVLRLAPGAAQLAVWADAAAFGAKDSALDGLAVLGDRLYVNAINSGQLFALDIGTGAHPARVTEVQLPRRLDTPDGMRAISATAMLVAENGKQARITRIDVAGDAATLSDVVTGLAHGANAVSPQGKQLGILEPQPFETRGDERRVRAVRVPLRR